MKYKDQDELHFVITQELQKMKYQFLSRNVCGQCGEGSHKVERFREWETSQ